jgi:transposase
VIEHRMHKRRCACGCVTAAAAPAGMAAPVSYGPGLRALAVHLVVFQLLPIGRTAELICDLTSATLLRIDTRQALHGPCSPATPGSPT